TDVATGRVVDFQGAMPVVERYNVPKSLGNWYPQVTHLNGMAVKPQSGLESALALQESVNKTLDDKMQADGVALNQDAVDVLYTYSAQQAKGGLSALGLDIVNCIAGKVGIEDTVTERQEDIMFDAI